MQTHSKKNEITATTEQAAYEITKLNNSSDHFSSKTRSYINVQVTF